MSSRPSRTTGTSGADPGHAATLPHVDDGRLARKESD